ncbi:hypothetical protein [Actinophytocola sp.]|uniref:hypothetical protein n=1 Tax=Actinophytocola sp. TaxID=1872138 RepID=UPI003D6A1933
MHRGGNRRLNSVLYIAAIVQKRRHPAAQALLARHEPAKGSRGGAASSNATSSTSSTEP